MAQESKTALLLSACAVGLLGFAAWLSLGGTGPSGHRSAVSTKSSGGAEADDRRRYRVPRCPIALSLNREFSRVGGSEDHNLVLRSKRKRLQVEVSCRRAAPGYEPEAFVRKTRKRIRERYGEILKGNREYRSGDVRAFSAWAEVDGELRVFHLLGRDRARIVIAVLGPPTERTREFALDVLDSRIDWRGAP